MARNRTGLPHQTSLYPFISPGQPFSTRPQSCVVDSTTIFLRTSTGMDVRNLLYWASSVTRRAALRASSLSQLCRYGS